MSVNPLSNNILKETLKNILIPDICSSCGEISSDILCEKCRQEIIKIKDLICNFCGSPIVSPIFTKDQEYPSRIENFNFLPENKFSKGQINKIKNKINLNILKNYVKPAGISGDDFKSDNKLKCSICKNSEFQFYKLRSFGLYTGVLKELIIKFKYKKIYMLAPVLCSFLKEAFLDYYKDEKIDYIETVPDFTDKRTNSISTFYYGVNHMQMLADLLSGEIKLPYANNLIKIKKTLRQQNLGMYERKVNLEGAFKVTDVLKAVKKNILLIDDVWTTGNTLNEISKTLKKCGADKIYLLTIARAIW
jgi:competence protein ComFC